MEAILVKEGVVVNRVNIMNLENGALIFSNYTVVQDDEKQYSIGDAYAG
tara:strand:+ start:2519 stop:2665 length:147 start_codon:yes stop_codon:yes gene_type:complete